MDSLNSWIGVTQVGMNITVAISILIYAFKVHKEVREIRERVSALEGENRGIKYMQVLDALKTDRGGE